MLVLPGAAFGMASFDYPVQQPVLSIAEGDVTVKPAAGDWGAASAGMLLNTGDSVRTGPGAKAEISCATGKMRLYENTIIVIPEVVDEGDKKDVRQVNLEEGTGLFRIRKRGVEKGFEVHTQQIIAGVKGTLFAVQTTGQGGYSRVAVYSGLVEVSDLKRSPGSINLLGKGQAVEARENGDGSTDTKDFDPDNAWGRWKGSATYEMYGAPWSAPRPPAEKLHIETGGGGDDSSCPPVIDNDGNVVDVDGGR
jgi:ferric-dicitrate binding protein FerR (iron transport regulator)